MNEKMENVMKLTDLQITIFITGDTETKDYFLLAAC